MPKDCKYCNNPIAEWKEVGGRKVPYNPDGSPHKCKDGKLIKTAIPADSLPTIGLLVSYDENLATFLTEDGRQHSYANTKDNYQAWQRAGHNMPPENHPDVWLAFRLNAAKFVMGGATVAQRPPWADRVKDPTGGEVKQPFKTGKEILQQNLDQKRTGLIAPETPQEAAGSSGPTNLPAAPETAPQTTLAPVSDADIGAAHELFENIANADPRILEALKQREPELYAAFLKKLETVLVVLPATRQKGPIEESRFPTPDELLNMVYNYDTYWKAKTILDLMAADRIAKQVEFKNRLECINTAITYCHLGAPTKSPKSSEVYDAAWDIYQNIQKEIGTGRP